MYRRQAFGLFRWRLHYYRTWEKVAKILRSVGERLRGLSPFRAEESDPEPEPEPEPQPEPEAEPAEEPAAEPTEEPTAEPAAESAEDVQAALSVTGEFAQLTGQELSAPKCYGWATEPSLRRRVAGVQVNGSGLNIVLAAKSLGAFVSFGRMKKAGAAAE